MTISQWWHTWNSHPLYCRYTLEYYEFKQQYWRPGSTVATCSLHFRGTAGSNSRQGLTYFVLIKIPNSFNVDRIVSVRRQFRPSARERLIRHSSDSAQQLINRVCFILNIKSSLHHAELVYCVPWLVLKFWTNTLRNLSGGKQWKREFCFGFKNE